MQFTDGIYRNLFELFLSALFLECAYSLLRKTVLVHLPLMRQVCLIFSSEITHGQTACVQSCSLVKKGIAWTCLFLCHLRYRKWGAQCHKYELFFMCSSILYQDTFKHDPLMYFDVLETMVLRDILSSYRHNFHRNVRI